MMKTQSVTPGVIEKLMVRADKSLNHDAPKIPNSVFYEYITAYYDKKPKSEVKDELFKFYLSDNKELMELFITKYHTEQAFYAFVNEDLSDFGDCLLGLYQDCYPKELYPPFMNLLVKPLYTYKNYTNKALKNVKIHCIFYVADRTYYVLEQKAEGDDVLFYTYCQVEQSPFSEFGYTSLSELESVKKYGLYARFFNETDAKKLGDYI